MNLKCEVKDKVSVKGNAYTVLEIALTPNYVKTVFLDKAEVALLKSYSK